MANESRCYRHAPAPKYECLLFDVDDTIYSHSSGLSYQCSKNIQEYMIQKLGIEESEVAEVNRVLYQNYGTSMAGLKAIGYDFDNDDYHSFVHGRLPYQNLKPDPVLRNLLLSLPIRKVIFSNADEIHVAKVLKQLGLEDCFDGIINFESLNPSNDSNLDRKLRVGIGRVILHDDDDDEAAKNTRDHSSVLVNDLPKTTPVVCKPFGAAFEQAFKLSNINPHKTLFLDDSIRNIESGKRLGLHTVLVGTSRRTEGADYALESIHNIREAFPELWDFTSLEEGIINSAAVSVAVQASASA